jgi:glycosyltransferase involved in cell wall biosynthesis
MVQQRIFTLQHITTDWVWVMDADERVTPELASEIQARLADPGGNVAFWVPRKNLILGRWVRHSGWYPDYQLRLWRRDRAVYDELHPAHEQMRVDGTIGKLNEPFIHFNYERLGQLFQKQAFYAGQEAEILHQRGIRARPQNFVLQPTREFFRRYVRLRGFRDGWLGLLLSAVMAWFEFVRFWKLARLSGIEWSFGRARPQDLAARGHAGN